MGPCVVAQVPIQEPRRLRQWSGAAGGWFRITLVSFLATLPVEQLRAFPSSLSDCQTPTGWNCSGESLPHSQTRHMAHFCVRAYVRVCLVCVCVCVPRLEVRSMSASKFRGALQHIAVIVRRVCGWFRRVQRGSSLWGALGRRGCLSV